MLYKCVIMVKMVKEVPNGNAVWDVIGICSIVVDIFLFTSVYVRLF